MSTDFPALPLVEYDGVRGEIRNGDILLASGRYAFSKIIQYATGSCWSHAAFVLRLEAIERVMLLESVEGIGVRTLSLREYVCNFEGSGRGYAGRVAIARHRRFCPPLVDPAKLADMSRFAVDRLSYPYDEEEIGRITLRIVGGALGVPARELVRDNEFICSEYVYECFRLLGIEFKHDARGFISPADIARDPDIDLLWEIDTKAS
jgi:hypothetical protein